MRKYGLDTDYTENVVWVDEEHIEATPEETEELDEKYHEGIQPLHWKRIGYVDEWAFVTLFFTKASAEVFMVTNKHRHGEMRISVESAHRNPELLLLRNMLLQQKRRSISPTIEKDFSSMAAVPEPE